MKQEIPVKKNNDYVLDIIDLAHEGQGVGKIEGFTIFVDNVLPEEKVEVKIVKVTNSYASGKLLRIIEQSKSRISPQCAVFDRCGGCHLQHMDYKAQLEFKTNLVRQTIQRIGGLNDVTVKDTIGMENPSRYRNKAQYPVGMVNGQAVFGFYAGRSHDIIQGEDCMIQHDKGYLTAKYVFEFVKKAGISVYDEKSGKGIVRHIVVRVGYKTGEIMAVIVTNGGELPKDKELVEYLREKQPEVTSIVQNINSQKTNVILGRKNKLLYGKDFILDKLGEYTFKISPFSFFQVNPVQTEVLYSKVVEYANLTGKEMLFDLYCGIGTIALFLSRKAKKVYGIEVVEPAIENAKENAQLNNAENTEFICGEAEKVAPELYEKGILADVVVLDPPRKGCEKELLETVIKMKPEKVVYVSCNPATLARDLKVLVGEGYEVKEVQPVDMFPWTSHVEVIILLQRSKG